MSFLIRLVIAIFCFWLIITYLIPMLPNPIDAVVLVILVVAAIIWLARMAGFNIG